MPALASSPRMVGRRAELESLLEAFDEGRDGVPRTVVVRGEAGIGKTRLVQEFLTAAAGRQGGERPTIVATGQCVDLGPIGAPFGPIRRVLRDLHAAVGTETLRAAAGSPAVIATLAAFVPGIADEGAAADEHTGEFAEAIEVVLESLSAERHLVIVIEDLQWADAATLALLRTLASTLRGRHLTVVATYRSDDIDRFHPLRPVLAELDRTRAVVRVEIAPLSADEVAEQVALLSARDFPDDDVRALSDRSGGIPFLVEELVDLGEAQLPETLRDLVLARYARLSVLSQEVVRAMAAGGVRIDHDVLRAVSGRDDDELDAALREAIDARVIVADGAGYAFRHALTQEAVSGEMLPSERVRVHRRYAEHLAAHRTISPDAVSAEAEHWLVAREITPAFDATVVALRRSRATFAPATSVKLAERLTELWPQVPDAAARSGTTLAQLHLGAAQAWHELGDGERALRAANEGLSVAGDEPLVRAALLRQRFVHEFNTDKHPDRSDLHEAISLLEGLPGEEARVLLSRTLTNLVIEDSGPQSPGNLERAIAIAEELGDDTALAIALTNKSWRISDQERDEPRAVEPLERALALKVDPATRAYAGEAYVSLLSRLGRFSEAAALGKQLHADASRAGIERGTAAGIAVGVAHALFAVGDPDGALRYAQRARRLLDRPSRRAVVRLLATHYAWNDQPEERRALLEGERATLEESARRHPERRDWWVPETVDAALAAAAGLPPTTDASDWPGRIASIAAVVQGKGSPPAQRYAAAAGALVIRALGAGSSVDGVPELRQLVATAIDDWPAVGASPVIARFIRATLADADGGDPVASVEQWREVVAQTTVGIMPLRHRQIARLSLARALIASGGRDEAAEVLHAITTDAPAGGIASVGRWAAELARRAGVAASTHPASGVTGIDALTARERQVLALVAEGLTNSQIGERLFISPKTASVHVSAILAKVGAANRAEAAALFTAAAAEAS
ncbi:AAA family ATPase [Microbacterium sp. 4R-513]|uniref:helix-turn-helix transcriptional regulator n=1 Tax=Microbacterium sp. 4R-513 TaxID=2567934 RepID=UPI0013E1DA9B|nr:AAA family ATPase [Microbacterium sp. 4R-513]QIG38470.1 AAA family ATPase [Microbacterium sp. 4R-513]